MNTVWANSTIITAKCNLSTSTILSAYISWHSIVKKSFLFYSFTCVFIYISMDSYFSQWVVINYYQYLFWCSDLSPNWSVSTLLWRLLCPIDYLHHSVSTFLFPSTVKCFGLILSFPWIRSKNQEQPDSRNIWLRLCRGHTKVTAQEPVLMKISLLALSPTPHGLQVQWLYHELSLGFVFTCSRFKVQLEAFQLLGLGPVSTSGLWRSGRETVWPSPAPIQSLEPQPTGIVQSRGLGRNRKMIEHWVIKNPFSKCLFHRWGDRDTDIAKEKSGKIMHHTSGMLVNV